MVRQGGMMDAVETIRISRLPGLRDGRCDYKVFVDDQDVASLGEGQAVTVRVGPGRHSLRLKIDFCWSNTLVFDAASEDQRDFVCRSGYPAALFLYDSIFRRHHYIDLIYARELSSLPEGRNDSGARIGIFLAALFISLPLITAVCGSLGVSSSHATYSVVVMAVC